MGIRKKAVNKLLDAPSKIKKENSQYENQFGYLEGDTIVGKDHKSVVLTLVEKISKLIIPIKINSRKASDVRIACDNWFTYLPRNLFNPLRLIVEKNFLIGKPFQMSMTSTFTLLIPVVRHSVV